MPEQPQSVTLIEFGPFSFDKALGKLSKHGTPIRLRGMPLKILQHLVERPGEVVSRAELQKLLWQGTAFGDFEQGLNSAVNVVRKNLGDSADQPRYIETVPGQGYRFIAPLRSTVDVPEGPTSSTALDLGSIVIEKAPGRMSRWGIAAVLVLAALAGGAWWTFRSKPPALNAAGGRSANHEANDQYELAMNFLVVQNDIPKARKAFGRALEIDPDFVGARLQHATMIVIEIFNGYTNDRSLLIQAEEELHQAERTLPASDGLLLATQAAVYLAQGRLDRIPMSKLEEQWREGPGPRNPTWLVILRMLQGQTDEILPILRKQIELHPLENPSRMFLGEALRTQGDTAGAIQALQRALEQAPRNIVAAWFLTLAYLDAGQPERARAMLEGMRPEIEKNYMWRHAWAILLAAEGKREQAQQAMDEDTLKFAQLTWAVTSSTADFYALQGDASKAIEWLQLAIARGDERVAYFRRNPRLAMLRNDPRFQSLLNSVEARRK